MYHYNDIYTPFTVGCRCMVFPGTDAGMLHFLDVEKHEEYNGSLLRYTSMNYVETRVYTSVS